MADPSGVASRAEFGAALTTLRTQAGLSIREVVERSGALHGTVSGWFSGKHLPTKASFDMFEAVLAACGVTTAEEVVLWRQAAQHARFAPPTRPADARAPYKGLDFFAAADADLYFGRGEVVADALNRLAGKRDSLSSQRLLFLLGPSGSGKSSLVRAGVIPAITAGEQGFAGWSTVLVTPGGTAAETLLGTLAQLPAPARAVVLVDQFEELWSQGPGTADERTRFVEALVSLPEPALVVLCLRADFYGEAAREQALLPALRDNPLLLGPLDADQLRQVIVEPAARTGTVVDADLVEVLLAELAPRDSRQPHDGGALPLLSHALLSTWEQGRRTRMALADYLVTGGISGAVQQTADRVFANLSAPQQEAAQRLFTRLVTVDHHAETRRRAALPELLDTESAEDARLVLDMFVGSRLLTINFDSVEITHEALVGAWPRLRNWIDGNRTGLATHRALTLAAQVWEDSGRDEGALVRSGRLEGFSTWAAGGGNAAQLNNLEREFLAASEAHHEAVERSERQREATLRRLVVALAVLTVVSLVATVIAVVAYRGSQREQASAEAERANAVDARDQALSRQVAGEAARLRGIDPGLSAQLALAAHQVWPTYEATSAVLDSSAINAATRMLGPAGAMRIDANTEGTLLAAGYSDGTTRLFALDATGGTVTGQSQFQPQSSTEPAVFVEFHPRRAILAAGGFDGVGLWDVATAARGGTPTRLAELDLGGAQAYYVKISPDGGTAAVYTSRGEVLLWDITDPANPRPRPGTPAEAAPNQPSGAIAFSPDGRIVAAGGAPGFIALWDVSDASAQPTQVAEIALKTASTITPGMAFSPDGRMLAAGTTNAEVQRWDVGTLSAPRELSPFTEFRSYVNAVDFNADSSVLLVGSSDQTTQLWDLAREERLLSIPGPSLVTSALFLPGESALATASADGTIRLWPLPGPVLTGPQGTVFEMKVDTEGDTMAVAVGRPERAIYLWDTSDPTEPREANRLVLPEGWTFTATIALRGDGNYVAAATFEGDVFLWDISDPQAPVLHGPVRQFDRMIVAMAFSPDGSQLFAANATDGQVAVWDVRDPRQPRATGVLDSGSLAFSNTVTPDGGGYFVGTNNGTIAGWQIGPEQEPRPLPAIPAFASAVLSVAVSPDSRYLAAGSTDREVRIWDISDPQQPTRVADLSGPKAAIYALSFTPDGGQLIAGSGDDLVWVWDVADTSAPAKTASLSASGGRVNDVAFLDSGRIVLGGGSSMRINIWQTDVEAVAARICARRGIPITDAEWEQYLPGVPRRDPCGA